MDIAKSVRQFLTASEETTAAFNARQTAMHIGLQLEALAKKLDALNISGAFANDTRQMAEFFKGGELDIHVEMSDRAQMLCADAEMVWESLACAFSQGGNANGAMREVSRASFEKLIPCRQCDSIGAPTMGDPECPRCNNTGYTSIRDRHGVLASPSNWTAPDVERFAAKQSALPLQIP